MKYRRILICTLLSLAVMLTFSINSFAQDTTRNSDNRYLWITAGGGVGQFGPAVGLGLTWMAPNHIVSVRYASSIEVLGFRSISDVGLMYGVHSSSEHGFASVAAGLSYVNGVRRGKFLSSSFLGDIYEKVPFQTAGIPIEAQVFWRPFSVLGLGLYVFGDINPEMSTGGAMLSVQIGYLR